MPVPEPSSPARATRRYAARFVAAMIAYAIALPVTLVLLPRLGESNWRYVLVLVPVVPFAVLGWAVWRYLVEADELQRRMQLEALALAFAAGSVITFAYGMLQIAGAPAVSWQLVWPVYAGCWLLGILWARWRYR